MFLVPAIIHNWLTAYELIKVHLAIPDTQQWLWCHVSSLLHEKPLFEL